VICPNCGENNSENFRFCGMCGTSLEPRRPAGAPRVAPPSAEVQTASSGITAPRRTAVSESAPAQGGAPVASPSSPGLKQPPAIKRQDVFDPVLDGLRDQTFSGLDSFYAPEEPHTGRRVFLLLVLLGVLGAAGWWTYSQYLRATGETAVPNAANPGVIEAPATNSALQPAVPALPSSTASPSQPSATAPPSQPSQASPRPPASGPESAQSAAGAATAPTPAQSANPSPAQTAAAAGEGAAREHPAGGQSNPSATQAATEAKPERHQRTANSGTKAALGQSAVSASADKGDAAFRKGVAYLYGRGVKENCAEALKYLQAASAHQNAKALSAFGTMYATGHCVPRDLPTSYSWFAQALRVDPNNQILEKDLTAVWNQMTAPERQMAMRMKE